MSIYALSDLKIAGLVLPHAPTERFDFAFCNLALRSADPDAPMIEANSYARGVSASGAPIEVALGPLILTAAHRSRVVPIVNGTTPLWGQGLWLFGPRFRGPSGGGSLEQVLRDLHAVIRESEHVQVLDGAVGCLVCPSRQTSELAILWAYSAANAARAHALSRDWDRALRDAECSIALLRATDNPASDFHVSVSAHAVAVLAATRMNRGGRAEELLRTCARSRAAVHAEIAEIENELAAPLEDVPVATQAADRMDVMAAELAVRGIEDPFWVVRIDESRHGPSFIPTRHPYRALADLIEQDVLTRSEAARARVYLVGLRPSRVSLTALDSELAGRRVAPAAPACAATPSD